MQSSKTDIDTEQIIKLLTLWSSELGFDKLSITGIDLTDNAEALSFWLSSGMHGSMSYMSRNYDKRLNPQNLFSGTLSIISVRMQYRKEGVCKDKRLLTENHKAFISRYALGRDYHKTMRSRLKVLGKNLESEIGDYGYRVFTDSAPILERAIAKNAGLGWVGKNTMIIDPTAGSYFFLGEIFTDLKLPKTKTRVNNHCGTCTKCIEICPTKAIVAPYKLDARRCISYLTIESKDEIPIEFRPLIGNRIFGCDDCQIYCPWNKFAKKSDVQDFEYRNELNDIDLITLLLIDRLEFDRITQGSALRRISHEQWLRNIAVSLGNAEANPDIIQALSVRLNHESDLVRKHVKWALHEQRKKIKNETRTNNCTIDSIS